MVKTSVEKIKKIKYLMSIQLSMVFAAVIIAVTLLVAGEANRVLTDKVVAMTYNFNIQTKMNLDNYVSNMESVAMYLYSNKDYIEFDPSTMVADDYEKLKLKEKIADFLYGLCVMGKYADISIVYRNREIFGRLSEESKALFGRGLFEILEERLAHNGSNDCWISGLNDNFSRIYYVRRVNKNAILLCSVYSSDMKDVLYRPNDDEVNLNIAVVNPEGRIIYSGKHEEQGYVLTDDEFEKLKQFSFDTKITSDRLVAVSECTNGWYVVAVADTDVILKQRAELVTYVVTIIATAIIIAIVFCVWNSFKFTKPAERMLEKLSKQANVDSITGYYNKTIFEEQIIELLQNIGNKKYAFLYIDIDGLRIINNRKGHKVGDYVVMELAEAGRQVLGENTVYGRLEGDEFACLLPITATRMDEQISEVEKICVDLKDNLVARIQREFDDLSVDISIGIVFIPEYGKDYYLIFDLAERAMYAAKSDADEFYHFYDYSRDYNVWKGVRYD